MAFSGWRGHIRAWLCAAAFFHFIQQSHGLTFSLPSNGAKKCFYEEASIDSIMEASYRVIGSDYDAKVPAVDAEV